MSGFERINEILVKLDAGSFSGEFTFILCVRQPQTAYKSKKGAIIAFRRKDMTQSMMLLGLTNRDNLMYTIAPENYIRDGFIPFLQWPKIEISEAEYLIINWFCGDDMHDMADTESQVEMSKRRKK